MSFQILGLATAVPHLSISQAHAVTEAQPLCCENDQQRRLLETLYRRSGVEKRHSVILEAGNSSALVDASAGSTLQEHFETDGEESLLLQTAAPAVAQSFFRPWRGGDDLGPSTKDRMELYANNAPLLAQKAVNSAFEKCGSDPHRVSHLITVSCTGFSAPGFDLSIIRECGLRPSVTRTHIGFMGCHGALNALRVAQAYASVDPSAEVLVCAVELCSLHYQYGWNRDALVSNALFSDGAAALIGRTPTSSHANQPQVRATASTVVPDTEEMMGWNIRDNGFQMFLSSEVPDIIRRHLRPWLSAWVENEGLTVEDIGCWAIHPGGPRILQACQETLELSETALQTSFDVLAEFGNMSSPTVLFILERLLAQAAPMPCVMLAFGPGLSIEAALIE